MNDRNLFHMVDLAEAVREFSPCRKYQNAAIIQTQTGETIYAVNHIPEGEDSAICDRCPRMEKTSGVWNPDEECTVIHAEPAVIYKAARLGVRVEGGLMVSLYFPCMPCARAIVEAGIWELYYRDEYPDKKEVNRVKDYLMAAKVALFIV